MNHLTSIIARVRSTLACARLDRARVGNLGLLIALIALTLVFATSVAVAQGPKGTSQPRSPRTLLGTGFTYQGLLKASGTPVDGVTCDFQFGLYDALMGPNQIGTTQSASAPVTNGYFTISNLDFGSGAFNGDARWLDIQVRCPGRGATYTPLTPRQPLTPAPMALMAQMALALPGLYTQQNATSPNLIGGNSGNSVTSGVRGATIGGGGSFYTNTVTDDYGTVGGGAGNQAGDNAGSTNNAPYATVAGGNQNTASGFYATVGGGNGNTASGMQSTVPGGESAIASHYGEMAYSSGSFATNGDAQTSLYVLGNVTHNATQTELFLDLMSERITIASGRTATFDILVVARTNGGSSAGYHIVGVIKNQGGTTAFIGTPTVTTLGEDVAAWDVTVVADNTNDALEVKVTGAFATTICWVATVHTVEVSPF